MARYHNTARQLSLWSRQRISTRALANHQKYRSYSAQAAPLILTEKVGNVQFIALNRPEKKNAVDVETAKRLKDAFVEFNEDKDTKVAVLCGKGGTFCSGYDLSELSSVSPEFLQENYSLWSKGHGPMGPTKYWSKKPVIAAIEGYAVAGGMELALWCDLRVMESTAVMGVFCRRFGVPLLDGGTVRLQKLIGLSRALDLVLTGREIRAKEALDFGLVNRVADTGAAIGRAMMLAQEIAKFPMECLLADRESCYHAAYSSSSVDEALDNEFQRGIKVIVEESIPGAKKFISGVGRHGSFNLNKIQDK